MPQIRPIPGTDQGPLMVQAYAGSSGRGEDGFVLPAPFGGSPDGLGAYARPAPPYQPTQSGSGVLSGSPLVRSLQRVMQSRRKSAMRGFGDATTPGAAVVPVTAAAPVLATSMLVAVVMADLVLSGVAGYFVGKAVAPNHNDENKYAWWGVAAGLIAGPVGLGVEALVALNHKGSR
jgi:hypothetical protein